MNSFRRAVTARRDAIMNGDNGFTLVELIVVIVIIGILAAIAIPVFLGQQQQAADAQAKANLANAKIALTSYLADSSNTFPTDGAALITYGWPQPTNLVAIASGTDVTDFCLTTTDPAFFLGADQTEANDTAC